MELIRLFGRMRTEPSPPEPHADAHVAALSSPKTRKTYRRPLKSVDAASSMRPLTQIRTAAPSKSYIVARHKPYDPERDVARTLRPQKTVHFAAYARVFPSGGLKRVNMPPPHLLRAPKNVAEVYARKLTYNQSQWVAYNMPEPRWGTDAACAHLKGARYPQS